LFSVAKDAILEEISGRRKPERLALNDQRLFKKVMAVSLADPEISALSETCIKSPRDAFFAADTNQVTICPG
jgi:hypothetical protein